MQKPSDLDRVIEGLLPRLYNTAYYLTGDSHRAEDLVQETLAMFLESFRKNPARIRDPLKWCVRVLARTSWKKSPQASSEISDDLASDQPGPEDKVSEEEIRHMVRGAIQTLPGEERQVVSLHVFGGLTVREVSRVMEMPRSTVYERLQMGLMRLRRKLASVSGVALLPPGMVRSTELVGWLQALPKAPVPSSLIQWTAALPVAAAATGTTLVAHTTGGLLMAALSTKSALITAGAVMVISIIGLGIQLHEVHQRNQALETRVAAGHQNSLTKSEIASLRKNNQDLRRRLAALERERRTDTETELPGASTTAVAKTVSSEEVNRLLAEATSALNAHDRQRFAAAFLALIDAGPAAHTALISLVVGTGGSYNHIYHVLEGDAADYPFRRELSHMITERREVLSELLDAIFSRTGEIDGATLFAFDLMSYNLVQSDRPREEHLIAVLDVLSTALETEEDGVDWNSYSIQAAQALGRLGSPEVLPDLEEMLTAGEVSEVNKTFIAKAIASIGGEDGIAILERFRDSASESLRERVLRNLARQGGAEVSEFLEESLALEEDSDVRKSLVRAMSKRAQFRDQMVEKLDRGELGEGERLSLLESLFESEKEAHREKAWEYYERLDRDTQDEVVGAFAGKDARATEILFERLLEETFSDELARGLLHLDSRVVKRRADTLRTVAGDPGAPLHARGAAAGALSRVDAPAAVSGLLTGFDDLPERERANVVGYLADFVRGVEARKALQRIAETDSAPRVRGAAEKAVRR
jgi:RNA polymerase sigma-70 factor (ECF subfamily)